MYSNRVRISLFLTLWYVFSAFTLFHNKYVLTTLEGDPTVLGTSQLVVTLVLGYVQMYFPLGMGPASESSETLLPTKAALGPLKKNALFYKHMLLVGTMRLLTVLLGLVSLNYIPPAFAETIKSSAPFFTVLIAFVLLGQRTSGLTLLSLVPVMVGLGLCSANEIQFDAWGFLLSCGANFSECLQNVYSKLLLDRSRVSPAELQFYPSLASGLIQALILYSLVDLDTFVASKALLPHFLLNGLFFHFQSITSVVLMEYISPVTHSVANTIKRALLIVIALYLYEEPVSLLSGLGLFVLFLGVFLYNEAKRMEAPAHPQQA